MPYLDARIGNKAVLAHAAVYELSTNNVEMRLYRVLAVDTREGWVEEEWVMGCCRDVRRRTGRFVVRDLRTDELWPE